MNVATSEHPELLPSTLSALRVLRMRIDHLEHATSFRAAAMRLGIVILGIALGQAILYAPSLIGQKVILPLWVLSQSPVYYPVAPNYETVAPHDYGLTDLIFFMEPERQFAVSELHSGRFPLWTPYRFGGAPCWPLGLSPPWWPAYLIASPVVLVWTQMLVAQIAGIGAYFFFRRCLKLSFWPAAIVACCYPLSGAYIVWTGFWLPAVMCWLPWFFVAVDETVKHPLRFGGPSLAILTLFILIGGAEDIAGQVLLTSGLYAIWCLIDQYGLKLWRARPLGSITALSLGWLLGFMASAWLVLPMLEYVATGSRMVNRSHGVEERPPMGMVELPEFVLPSIYGSTQIGSYRLISNAYPESAAAGYAGMYATLLAAPLAFWNRRLRSINIFWVILGFITTSWILNVPGMVQILRLPGLNMMSHNRFVFVTAFAILALAASGCQVLWEGKVLTRKWTFVLPIAVVVVLLGWNIYRMIELPEPIKSNMALAVSNGAVTAEVRNLQDVERIKETFVRRRVDATTLALICLIGWFVLLRMERPRRWFVPVLGVAMHVNLLWFGFGRAPQFERSLFGRHVPLFDELAKAPPGRIIGFDCLPANLSQLVGLRDIRGYDGIDPARMIDLLKAAESPKSLQLPHAITQWLTPLVLTQPDGICRISPILDMLNVRYVIFRGTPPKQIKVSFREADYWAVTNPTVLPRAYIPSNVLTLQSDQARLAAMSDGNFDPRRIAYVERPINLPTNCQGSASIISETPTRIRIAANMTTPGLLVLSDLWDVGWHAYLNGGKEVEILRTNHAIRGVELPAGQNFVEFEYSPRSMHIGLTLAAISCCALLIWVALATRDVRKNGLAGEFVPSSHGF